MRQSVPPPIQDSAFSLSPGGLVSLFRLTLNTGSIYRLCNEQEVSWQGHIYEALPCNLSGVQFEADGKANRPNFSFANPDGLFTAAIGQGLLDNAQLTRFVILRDDLLANNSFALEETMRIAQVMSVSKGLVVTQLRDVTDSQRYLLPARAFYPPEFPHVRL